MNFKQYYSEAVIKIINEELSKERNKIFVLLGQTNLVSEKFGIESIAHKATFELEGSENLFNKNWFSEIFINLQTEKDFHLLSFPQFNYLISYLDSSFFMSRVIIIKDNLRQIFPLDKNDYIETSNEENLDFRPENLPIYQSEQLLINGKCYYVIKTPIEPFFTINLFNQRSQLRYSNDPTMDCIDISSDPYSLDIFINECIENDDFNRNITIKLFPKQTVNQSIINVTEYLNFILNLSGGSLLKLEEEIIQEKYEVRNETKEQLKKYWGDGVEFRDISVYKNPNSSNEIIQISQGLIVETIINEYLNSKNNNSCRDLFLTAPTGAGKSLLFQLPAFFISSKNDITIVVSPLIALMKDQVNAIYQERKFNKVAYINSELSLMDRDKIIENCKAGEIDLIYMSPELLLSYDISHFIGTRKLGLLVIDEAHLITTWGRDFRVDYWFLGNHIRKIRKFNDHTFPMVAVTATAIYGGSNDMVFDSIDSLVMHNPHIFIGQVKRNDIEFIISNYDKFTRKYEESKIDQTVKFIKEISNIGHKTLVYAPYKKHIENILNRVNDNQVIATGYHGGLSPENKEFAFRQFKSGACNVMISTKAFGMGVDISDIQVIYHHAPSGLLPDYVQEIGRAARNPNIQGFATLNYSIEDQRYSKALHGMSALRQYQLREVLKKIYKTYLNNGKNRNMLLSVDDFGHIFDNAFGLDQKVLTALMMIEKDYLAKNRFNVLIARPKKLFVKVYGRISNLELPIFKKKYSSVFRVINNYNDGNTNIEIDLDKVWFEFFLNKSFPVLKFEFYIGKLFEKDNINIIPQLKITFNLNESYNTTYEYLNNFFSKLQDIFAKTEGFFDESKFYDKLLGIIGDPLKTEKIAKFILSSYSGRLTSPGVIESNAFLQARSTGNKYDYRVFNTYYLYSFSRILQRLRKLFSDSNNLIAEKFIINKESNSINYVRLGYFLEIFELGTFEIKGGENPMIFIRINDPNRIAKDSYDYNYNNTLLSKTLERHDLSNKIFDHFFSKSFSNEERWSFIEEYFLGQDIDDLLNNFLGKDLKPVNIIEKLREKKVEPVAVDIQSSGSINIFQPSPNSYYKLDSLLTIETETEVKTMKVSDWLVTNPVIFNELKLAVPFNIDSSVYDILMSKLKAYHPEYYKNLRGLKHVINFKGYDSPVHASVPFKDKPVEFYTWWIKNPGSVSLTFKEKIELFISVNGKKRGVLKPEHLKMISK